MNRTSLPILLALLLLFSFTDLKAQAPFKRGVNLTGWFQTNSTRSVQFTKFTRKDFENIKSLGCDVIRLPINLFYMAGDKPGYTIDPLLFDFLDQAVNWAEELQIYLMIDNHTSDDKASKNLDLEAELAKIWTQIAARYKNRSGYLLYEVMNEPNGITTAVWGKIQQTAIDAIRANDTKHTIVVGPSSFNTYNELNQLPVYTDTNLLYTFHFYDPFLFTHQGATWVTPSMVNLAGVPFPAGAGPMPVMPPELAGSWIGNAFNSYASDGTVAKVKQLIDVAIAFKNSRKVPVFCGEFGVYMQNSNDVFRVSWYDDVRKYLEVNNIPWTIWDYQGGFGLFQKGTDALFDYHLNIPMVKALGLTAPAQKVYVLKADSIGFPIYSDWVGEHIMQSVNSSSGTADFYSDVEPNNGKYCLYWNGSAQYGYLGFDFVPNKDLSHLVADNYALSFLVRGNTPGTKFDVRFVDSKTTNPQDHPWRMGYTITESQATWDGQWHKIYLPLKNFIDQGAWDGSWFNSIGAFDWKATDHFYIVAEQGDLTGKSLWFDNICLTNKDTLQVRNNTITYVTTPLQLPDELSFQLFPNPVKNYITINYNLKSFADVSLAIYNMNGQKIKSLVHEKQIPGSYALTWDLHDLHSKPCNTGVYLCCLSLSGKLATRKIVLQKND